MFDVLFAVSVAMVALGAAVLVSTLVDWLKSRRNLKETLARIEAMRNRPAAGATVLTTAGPVRQPLKVGINADPADLARRRAIDDYRRDYNNLKVTRDTTRNNHPRLGQGPSRPSPRCLPSRDHEETQMSLPMKLILILNLVTLAVTLGALDKVPAWINQATDDLRKIVNRSKER